MAVMLLSRDKEAPDEDRLKLLSEMLWFADQAYEGESERTLHNRLVKKGTTLAALQTGGPGSRKVQHWLL